jgi:hypothetical protein
MDLRNTVVPDVAQDADQGDDIETELVLWESESAFLIGS